MKLTEFCNGNKMEVFFGKDVLLKYFLYIQF